MDEGSARRRVQGVGEEDGPADGAARADAQEAAGARAAARDAVRRTRAPGPSADARRPPANTRAQEESLPPAGPAAGDGRQVATIESSLPPQPTTLGYEEVAVGPTSNFVGNHMTQAAVDLVQYQLRRPDLEHERRKHLRYQQTYHPPRRVGAAAARPAAAPEARAVERYTWADAGAFVEVRIDALAVDARGRAADARPLQIARPELRVLRGGTEVVASFSVERRGGGDARAYSLVLRGLHGAADAAGSELIAAASPRRGAAALLKLKKLDASRAWPRLLRPFGSEDADGGGGGPPRLADGPSGGGGTRALALRDGAEGALKPRGPSDADLAKMRRALIQQRAAKAPGDGLLLPRDFRFP